MKNYFWLMMLLSEEVDIVSYEERLSQYKTYEDLSIDEFNKEYDYIMKCWDNFLAANAPDLKSGKDYFVHKRNLFEVIRRVDKRRVYYKVFHDLTKINEFKYIALLCYWINTLKPFMVVDESSSIYNAPNELFSVYLIISMVRGVYGKVYVGQKFKYPSSRRITDMAYNFKFCDMSREATIAFVETFADNYGVGIQHILENNP